MAHLVLSPEAQEDSDRILTELARHAGLRVAQRYADDFDALYDILKDHPESGPGRPRLGRGIRIGVVSPYIVIYAHDGGTRTVAILRIVHGKRRITRRLLHDRPR